MQIGLKHHEEIGEAEDSIRVFEDLLTMVLIKVLLGEAINNSIDNLRLARYGEVSQ